jgi:hypothetical protein
MIEYYWIHFYGYIISCSFYTTYLCYNLYKLKQMSRCRPPKTQLYIPLLTFLHIYIMLAYLLKNTIKRNESIRTMYIDYYCYLTFILNYIANFVAIKKKIRLNNY